MSASMQIFSNVLAMPMYRFFTSGYFSRQYTRHGISRCARIRNSVSAFDSVRYRSTC